MNSTDLVNIQDNEQVNEMNEASEIKMYEEIEDSPFIAIRNGNDKWVIIMGKYRVSRTEFNDLEELKEYVKSKPWELIMVTTSIYMHMENELKTKKND